LPDKYHGKGGLLSVRVSPYEEGIKLASAFVDAAVEQGYHKGDVNSELVGESEMNLILLYRFLFIHTHPILFCISFFCYRKHNNFKGKESQF